ncbi:MAG TPA: type II secretion system protein [Mycobacterium sp.]|nr:type II secretion system protein [Mycobacterium sp.]
MPTIRKRLHAETGFTLVEMVAAMAILTIVIAAFAQLLAFTIKRSGRTEEQSTVQTQARAGLDAFASDLRQAMCNDLTTPVTTANASQLTFYTPDRATPFHLKQDSYQVSGGSFQREFVTSTNTGGPPWTMPNLSTASWITVFGGVSAYNPGSGALPYFKYYDDTNTPTTDPTQVARVDIAMNVTPAGSTGGDGPTTYLQTINLRTPECN